MELRICSSLSSVNPAAWDTLVGDASPFLEWGWLASLEDSGCVAPASGWFPQHLTLWDEHRLIGAVPVYVKHHSQGEFVFDHGWAEAAHRVGIPYYPKLLAAVPFTPVTGARFLTHPAVERARIIRVLAAALKEMCTQDGYSSVHVNFCLPDEVEALSAIGFESRVGYQFQWINPGWRTFDDYLGAFRSKRRVQIKRERRELESQGIEIDVRTGEHIPNELFEVMFQLYKSTIDKLYWGRQYLNEQLFALIRQRWNPRLCFFIASRNRRPVAGTFTVRKGNALYGRYWGTHEELRYLHFNVCYYASIEYCLREGITRFEPGAGGEFKYLRGFNAQPTQSMHFVANARLAQAVRNYLSKERRAVGDEIAWLEEQSPLKR